MLQLGWFFMPPSDSAPDDSTLPPSPDDEVTQAFWDSPPATQTTSGDNGRAYACSRCNSATEWCDDNGRCVPFTAAEQTEWAATSPPPGKIATSPRPTWIRGVPNKTVMIGAGLAVAALLLLRR
jgi:hypothetical protein